MGRFRVLVCGDSPEGRQSLEVAFSQNAIFEVLGGITSAELVKTAVDLCPDVALWKLKREDPEPVISCLLQQCPFVLPSVLVDDPRRLDLLKLARMGVRGCLPMRLLPQQVVQAVELIVVAGIICFPRLGREVFEHKGPRKAHEVLSSLTIREREICNLLLKNFSNREIARTLFLSESTVKTHVRSVFQKLEVRNRAEALAVLLRLGLHPDQGMGVVTREGALPPEP